MRMEAEMGGVLGHKPKHAANCRPTPEAGREARNRFSLSVPGKEPTLLTGCFQTSDLPNFEKIDFDCFQPPS